MAFLKIYLLGDFRLIFNDKLVTSVATNRMQSLLAYLVLHRDAPQPRQRIACLLWPRSNESQARTNLRNLIHLLRQALPNASDYLCMDGSTIQWKPDSAYVLDVADLENAMAAGMFETVIDLYAGDLLPDCYDDWVVVKREQLRQMYANALEELIHQNELEHDYRAAIDYAQRLIRHEPLQEHSYRELMRMYASCRDSTGIIRTYNMCANVLLAELDVKPSDGTQEVYEECLRLMSLPDDLFTKPKRSVPPADLSNNLPFEVTRFIGRERERREGRESLAAHRLVTLTGAGGIGKTRLAIQIARESLEQFLHGVWFVELAPLAKSGLVPTAVANVLGIQESRNRPMLDELADYLRDKNMLLVLDNCEHLVKECAHLSEYLLSRCPNLHLLTTSRETLRVEGEVTIQVSSLSLPSSEDITFESIGQSESVQLFIERAADAFPGFKLVETNMFSIASICRCLDGIALAIVLSAARVKILNVEQIAARLDNAIHLLTQGSRTALPRQQTLQATLDWSYNLLSDAEQTFLNRLSVFAGGWTLEAAEAVCMNESAEVSTLDLLTQLVNKSLIVVEYNQDQDVRYHLLETIRQYGLEKLAKTGEEARVCGQHLAYFLKLAEEADPHLYRAEQLVWMTKLDKDYDNLRKAFDFSLSDGRTKRRIPPDASMRLVGALTRYWYVRGYWQEGNEAFNRAITSSGQSRTVVFARALSRAGIFGGGGEKTIALWDECIALCRTLGEKPGLARALLNKAAIMDYLGETVKERKACSSLRSLLEESLALYRELGDNWGIAAVLYYFGQVAYHEHDTPSARCFLQDSIKLVREIGDRRLRIQGLNLLGLIAKEQGEWEAACHFLEECLNLARELRDKNRMVISLCDLGNLVMGRGDYKAATDLLEEGLAITRQMGDSYTISDCLFCLGRVARFRGNYKQAEDLQTESLFFARKIESDFRITLILIALGELARLQGDDPLATGYYVEAEATGRYLDDKTPLAYMIEAFAALCIAQRKYKYAATLLGAADTLRAIIHKLPLPVEHTEIEQNIAFVKAQLDEKVFTKAWNEGQNMTNKQAVALLQMQLDPSKHQKSNLQKDYK